MYNRFKATSYLTIIILLYLFIFPVKSHSDWVDKSDQLPGMSDTNEILLYVAGAAVLATLIIIVANSGGDDGEAPDSNSVVPDSSSTSGLYQFNGFSLAAVETISQTSEPDINIIPIMGLKRSPGLPGNKSENDMGTVVFGFSIKF